jgi:hypothetical protein
MILPLTQRPAWKALQSHYRTLKDVHLRQLFAEDPRRGERLTAEAAGLFLDYSKNRVTDETLHLLLQLAEESGLRGRIDARFRGEKINVTEQRAVLHVALRAPKTQSIVVDGVDVVPQVHEVLEKMARFSDRVRSGTWLGHTGKPIRNVVNIGIGGSDLGPVMACEALRHYSLRAITCRFVSNVDGTDFAEATHDLDPAETLFVVSSKTFTTVETMTNARTAREWSLRTLLYNDQVLDTPRIHAALEQRGNVGAFEKLLKWASWVLAGSFLVSAVLNFCLASWLLTAAPGTPQFNDQLGKMNWLSWPVITLPSMAMMFYALFRLLKGVELLAGLNGHELFHHAPAKTRSGPAGVPPAP